MYERVVLGRLEKATLHDLTDRLIESLRQQETAETCRQLSRILTLLKIGKFTGYMGLEFCEGRVICIGELAAMPRKAFDRKEADHALDVEMARAVCDRFRKRAISKRPEE